MILIMAIFDEKCELPCIKDVATAQTSFKNTGLYDLKEF
jgi:hypothetical protein